jgi:2-polyprenyl-3-methyl-5-hydroxy-6-metoxy-1,4-benzoquinol methylase
VEVVVKRFLRRAKTAVRLTAYFIRTGYAQTGERVNPDFPDLNFQNHLKVYKFLEQFAKDKDVLDIGCGLGYGTDHIRAFARTIVGIDISRSAIRFARKRYPSAKTLLMDAQSLQLEPKSIDLAISTENFEHLSDQEQSLREVVKVLRPDGVCFIATPNRNVSMETNQYHTHEFTASELEELLSRYFNDVQIWTSMLQSPDPASLAMPDTKSLTLFGIPVDATYLSNTHSLFSFSRHPK